MKWSLIVFTFALSTAARAEVKTVTVLGVVGQNGDTLARTLEEGLGELYEVVDSRVYRDVAVAIGHATSSPTDVKLVARRKRIDAIVAGRVADQVLRLTVRDGGDGRIAARIWLPLKNGALEDPNQQKALRDLVRAFETVKGVARGRQRALPSGEALRKELTFDETRSEESRPNVSPGEPLPSTGPGEALPTVEAAHRLPFRSGQAIEIGAGFGLMGRSLDFHSGNGVSYHSGALSALRIEAALFPFAYTAPMRKEHPILSTFGVVASWVEALPFHAVAPNGQAIASTARRFSAALALRLPTGPSLRPSLLVSAGFSEIQFMSADPAALGVPDTQYQLATLAFGIDVPLASRRVSLSGSVALHAVFDAGKLSAVENYGGGTGWGGDGSLALTVRPLTWLWLRALGRGGALSLSFGGAGARGPASFTDALFDGMLEIGFAG